MDKTLRELKQDALAARKASHERSAQVDEAQEAMGNAESQCRVRAKQLRAAEKVVESTEQLYWERLERGD